MLDRTAVSVAHRLSLPGIRYRGTTWSLGVFRGESFAEAYRSIAADRGEVHRFIGGEEIQDWFEEKPRFFAFDSFAGLPGDTNENHIDYAEGSYACSEDDFLKNIRRSGVDIDRVVTVPGFYDESLQNDTRQKLSLSARGYRDD